MSSIRSILAAFMLAVFAVQGAGCGQPSDADAGEETQQPAIRPTIVATAPIPISPSAPAAPAAVATPASLAIPSAAEMGGRTSALDCITLPIDRDGLAKKGLALYEDDCLPELKRTVTHNGKPLTDDQYELVLATIVSHYTAPYGSSSESDPIKLLSEPTMNCGNYGFLLAWLVGPADLKFVGTEGGAIGNHQQIFIKQDGEKLLLDPTVGLVAFTGFNDLFSGKPVDQTEIYSFFSGDQKIAGFHARVKRAIQDGKYRPRDILYYYDSVDQAAHPSKYGRFLTPGGVSLRKKRHKDVL